MDLRKLFFGLGIVFAVFGLVTLAAPDLFYGRGTFYEHNFGMIRSVSVGGLVLGGVFAVLGASTRRS